MIIGVIGTENSHTAAIAQVINVEKKIKDCSVDFVWGEAPEFTKNAVKVGKIANVVKRSEQMLGKIDALIVDHRHPKYHLKAALPFVKAGIPVFVDKPFCYRADKGKEFLKVAKKYKTPVTSFSVLPEQASFRRFVGTLESAGKIVAGSTYGPCDLKCRYGGVFFYGIHQVDMALKAFGYNVSRTLITKNGNGATGQLIYSDGKIVNMHFIKEGTHQFGISAIGTEKTVARQIVIDKSMYLTGIKRFTKMFKTGIEPESYEHMLKPVQILESLERSVKSGQIEKVLK